MILLLQPISVGTATAQSIPDWIKQNADWWEQGLISDKDFASGLGFMVKERLIQVENIDFDSNGDIEISDDIEIPDWIKNNARWWVDGVISDNDFKSGIQHMVRENVISFKERPNSFTQNISSEQSLEMNSENLKNLYALNKWNELTAKWLLEVKNTESKLSDELATSSWNIYSENKNQELMTRASELDKIQKNTSNDASFLVGVLAGMQEIEKTLKENANELGISPQELESLSMAAIQDVDEVKRLQNLQDIEDAYKQAAKAQKQADNKKIQIDSAVDDSDEVCNDYECDFDSSTETKLSDSAVDDSDVPYVAIFYGSLIDDQDPTDKPTNLLLQEKTGKFLGDPCDENSKQIHLYYKFKQVDQSFLITKKNTAFVSLGLERFSIYPNHFVDEKLIHKGLADWINNEHIKDGADPDNLTTGEPLLESDDVYFSDEFKLEHKAPLKSGKHTFTFQTVRSGGIAMGDGIVEEFQSNQPVSIDVIVPECPFDSDSAVDDSDDYVLLDNYSQKSLVEILEKVEDDSNKLTTIIDTSKKIISKLKNSMIDDNNSIIDDYLPGLDDEIEDSQDESTNNDATIPDDDITNDDFIIEANPMSLTLSNGEYGEILVKTKSLYGWKSPVQITIPIIPSPMTYPPGYPHYVYPTPESETSSMIPVQISGRACTGEYILRIFGYGEHPAPNRVLEVHEVRVAINTVREPSLEFDSLEPSITIAQGGSHTFQLSFKSLDYADYSYIVDTVDGFSPPSGVSIETPPTFVSVPEQTTVYASVTITVSASTTPTTFELPIYAKTGFDCYNPYGETTSVTVNIVPIIDEETEMVELIPVTALSIGDQQYPISQFTLWQWEGECDDQWHYHSPTGHAVALDGITGISDPDQGNCGFGKVSSFTNLSAWMSQSQVDNFKELTGYDPLHSEAMMGGSGP